MKERQPTSKGEGSRVIKTNGSSGDVGSVSGRDIKLRIERNWAQRFEDEKSRKALHAQRARLIHGLVDALDLEVKDWGETDAAYPREVVEIIVALGSAGVSTAVVSVVRAWLDRDKIKDVRIVMPDGTNVSLRGASARDVEAITGHLGLRSN